MMSGTLVILALTLGAPEAFSTPNLELTTTTVHPFRLLDLSADALAPGEYEVGVLFGRVSRGLFPRFHVSAHLAAYLISFLNVNARYLLVDLPEFRLSIDAGVWWLAGGAIVHFALFYAPLEARASVPLPHGFEATFAFRGSWQAWGTDQSTLRTVNVSTEATVTRYDAVGAWFLQAKVPLVAGYGPKVQLLGATLEGFAPMGNVSAWSVMLGRDLKLGRNAHLRLAAGYRNRPGLVGIESIGPVAYNVDFYWRF